MAYFTRTMGLAALLAFPAIACGPEFDPASNLATLRILAVKKDDPYVRVTAPEATDDSGNTYQPDNTVELTMGLEDARPTSERLGDNQKFWFAGCNNPYADNYFPCLVSVWLTFKAYDALGPKPLEAGETWGFADAEQEDALAFIEETFPAQYAAAQAAGEVDSGAAMTQLLDQLLALRIGAGDTFSYTMPEWLIEQHALPSDPDLPLYGMSQIYSTVCDGQLALSEEWQGELDPTEVLTDATRGFPLTCVEPDTGEQRGPDHFMVAYSNVYAYEELVNKNPVIRGASLDGDEVDASALCIGVTCPLYEDACDNPRAPRVKRCRKSRADDCPTLDFMPLLDEEDNSEVDQVATDAESGGGELLEQMWLRYYADGGEIVRQTKRLQDATAGWFSDYGTEWRSPRTVGTVRLWSVVYDNRGGVDWVRTQVCVTD